jgi:hypothetical protein
MGHYLSFILSGGLLRSRLNYFSSIKTKAVSGFAFYFIMCGNIVKKYIFAPKFKINNGT